MPFNVESRYLSLESVADASGESWILNEDVMYMWLRDPDPLGGWIVARHGMRFDLASIPACLRWLVSNDDPRIRRPAAIHDWLYFCKGKLSTGVTYTREQCDRIFYDALLEEKMGKFKAWLMWRAVRIGGKWAWDK